MRVSIVHFLAVCLLLPSLSCSDGNLYPFPEDGEMGETAYVTVQRQAEKYDISDSKQSNRAWYIIPEETPAELADPDESHAETAGGGAYLEALPDLLVSADDPADDGNGLENDPVEAAQVGYWVTLKATGRYYVWVRAHPTSSRDNAIHVGIDGEWPETGRDLQFLDEPDQGWVWSSNQRFSGGEKYGIPQTIYFDVETTGKHLITFAMREDGFEFDKWLITTNPNLVP